MKRCTGISINGMDIGMSIKKRDDILNRSSANCIMKSDIE